MTLLRRSMYSTVALAGAAILQISLMANPAAASSAELADNYRRANDSQRLAYLEKVIGETRLGIGSPARVRALAAVAKACVDDWDPKLEPEFASQVGACIVMANRRVGYTP